VPYCLVAKVGFLYHHPLFHGVQGRSPFLQYFPCLGGGIHKIPGTNGDGPNYFGAICHSCFFRIGLTGSQKGRRQYSRRTQCRIFQEVSSFHWIVLLIFKVLNIRNMIVEVCANSLESAINAQKAGADRIELCVELGVGGLTPSYGLLKRIKEYVSIPINVLIRPRSGDFTYSDLEFNIMRTDIELCKNLGFNGIVSGVLLRDLTLDVKRTKELV